MKSWKIFFCSLLWLEAVHVSLLCLFFLLSLLESFELVWLFLLVGALAPGAYFLAGLKLPKALQGTWLTAATLVWGIGVFWAVWLGDYLSISQMWGFNLIHRFCAMFYFQPVFHGYQAFVQDILQPLAIASTQVLMMGGFVLGLKVRKLK